MKLSTKLLTASAMAALALGAASAASAGVFISFDGSTDLFSQPADGAYNFSSACTATSCGGFASFNVNGSTDALPSLLHSADVSATTADGRAGDLTIFVTRTDISSPNYTSFFSSLTSNNTTIPFTVTLSTFVDPTNHKYDGNLLSTFSTSAIGSNSFNQTSAGSTGGGLYSVTEEYHIVAAAGIASQSTSPTIVLSGFSTAVPEPATWGLMLVGFGGMGAILRNRRRAISVAA